MQTSPLYAEPNPEVFQQVKIDSCVEVAVRITDDIPLLNWIPHFAMKMRTGRGWKKSVAQDGEEEVTEERVCGVRKQQVRRKCGRAFVV